MFSGLKDLREDVVPLVFVTRSRRDFCTLTAEVAERNPEADLQAPGLELEHRPRLRPVVHLLISV